MSLFIDPSAESPPQPFSMFVSQGPFHDVNTMIVDNDQLSKRGRLGKFVARHRVASICFVVVMFLFGCASLLWASGSYFFNSFAVVAAGVEYRFGHSTLPYKTSTVNGVVVERLIEPTAPMVNHFHALLVFDELRTGEVRKLTRDDVRRGYAEWKVTERTAEGLHNFTFEAAKALAAATRCDSCLPCICYLEFGLPYNAVFIRSSGDVLYEPEIVGEAYNGARNVTIADRGPLRRLLNAALEYTKSIAANDSPVEMAQWNEIPAQIVSVARGIVSYITEQANFRRWMISDDGKDLLPCIKHCVAFFQR